MDILETENSERKISNVKDLDYLEVQMHYVPQRPAGFLDLDQWLSAGLCICFHQLLDEGSLMTVAVFFLHCMCIMYTCKPEEDIRSPRTGVAAIVGALN
ncbi:hypothetical protein STEG23_030237 [Scotinomys teguina]